MTKGHIKQVFPGGNTPRGFVSYYQYLAYPKRIKIFVMKGGPGVGKSTFMRRIGTEMVEQGFDTEFHHCSSDNGSLDGVYFSSIGVAILDGTAPHVVDPGHPGAVDEIVHLGDFWNEEAMRKNVKGIVDGFSENARLFRVAYGNLAAAKIYADEIESYYKDMKSLDIPGLNSRARELVWDIFGDLTSDSSTLPRHLFGSAISPKGPINFLETVYAPLSKRYIITGDMGTGKSTLIQKIYDEGCSRGFYLEAFHCPMSPDRIEHLVIPDLDVAVLTSTNLHSIEPADGDIVVDTCDYVNVCSIDRIKGDMANARELYAGALDRAVSCIARAKSNHDALEQYYIPNIDFDGVARKREEILNRILTLAD